MTETFEHNIRLEWTDDGQVAWLQFESEHRANVFTGQMLHELLDKVTALVEGDSPRVLVIKGKDQIFSGGADLKSILDMDEEAYVDYIETEYELFRLVENAPFITLAVLAGACIGNGAELALCCDFRLAAEGVRFGLPEMSVGFIAPAQRISQYVGIGRAKELLYTSKMLDGPSALDLGLVTRVVADEDLSKEAEAMAGDLANIAPLALRLTKRGIARAYGSATTDFDKEERDAALETFKSSDFQEGAASVLERRPARFTDS